MAITPKHSLVHQLQYVNCNAGNDNDNDNNNNNED